MSKKKLLRVKEIVERYSIAERTLYRFIKEGTLKASHVGSWLVAEDDLERFIASRRNKPKKSKKK